MKTWKQIGTELGIPGQNAYRIYLRALKKIRRMPGILEDLRRFAVEIETHRAQKGFANDSME
jgi:hypothetical protein